MNLRLLFFSVIHRGERNHVLTVLTFLSLGLLMAGCMADRTPKFGYTAEGEKVTFKRYEGKIALDWIHHQVRRVYTVAEAPPSSAVLSEEQKSALSEYGSPEYTRPEFRSESNEFVTEWVYWRQGKVLQFVGGHLVYEGPVTDYEKVLLERGRPDSAFSQPSSAMNGRVDHFTYTGIFDTKLDQYRLANDRLVTPSINR